MNRRTSYTIEGFISSGYNEGKRYTLLVAAQEKGGLRFKVLCLPLAFALIASYLLAAIVVVPAAAAFTGIRTHYLWVSNMD